MTQLRTDTKFSFPCLLLIGKERGKEKEEKERGKKEKERKRKERKRKRRSSARVLLIV